MGSTTNKEQQRCARCFCLVTVALVACVEQPRSPGHFATIDSAGVTVVENATPAWTPKTAWQLPEDPALTIGFTDSEPDKGPLDPVSVFRTPTGNIVVSDGNQVGWNRLLVYDKHGVFQSHISRKGEGPCEFGQLWWAEPYRQDSIAAFDMAYETIVVLGKDGGCSRSIRLPQGTYTREQARAGMYTAGAEGVYPDGTMLVYPIGFVDIPAATGPAWYHHILLRMEPDGGIRDTLGMFRIYEGHWDGRRTRHIGYGRSVYLALDGFDLIYGEGPRFELLRFDSAGVLKQIIRRPFSPEPVTHEDKAAAVSIRIASAGGEEAPRTGNVPTIEQRIAGRLWAETKPPFSAILVDSLRNIWVEDYRFASSDFLPNNPPPTYWSVFASDGRWLGRVEVPGNFFLRRIYDDMVFGIWRDDDGVGSVRGYALIKPKG